MNMYGGGNLTAPCNRSLSNAICWM